MTQICCANCGSMVEKPQKEITRQHKKGNYNFFCHRICYQKYQAKNHSDKWDAVHHRARRIYLNNNSGPHDCLFCSKRIRGAFEVHHKDNNYLNNNLDNLAPAHKTCHQKHHKGKNYKQRKLDAFGAKMKSRTE